MVFLSIFVLMTAFIIVSAESNVYHRLKDTSENTDRVHN